MELLFRWTGIRPRELGPTLLSGVLFFVILCSYYILRPLREEMGIAGGVEDLTWLFQLTLVATLLATPVFGWLTRRFPRRTFLVYSYRFFAVNLLVFFLALKSTGGGADLVIGRVFYVWISVYNLFLVSLFWAFMADGFHLDQSKRLFGPIAVGGSLGAVAGSSVTAWGVHWIGRMNLILISVVLLEVAVQLIIVLRRRFDSFSNADSISSSRTTTPPSAFEVEEQDTREPGPPIAGWPTKRPSLWEGFLLVVRSPYLAAIALFLFCYSFASTVLYFEQAHIVAESVADRAARASLFASIDVWVNVTTVITQLFLTSRIMTRLGVGWALLAIPLLSAVGFAALGFSPTLSVLVLFQVIRRAGNYAIMRPARETLFTVVSVAEKYKAKSFLDTFVYRGGDALSSALFGLATRRGMTLSVAAFAVIPLALIWGAVGFYLGHKQKELA